MKILISAIISIFLVSCGEDDKKDNVQHKRAAQVDSAEESEEGFGLSKKAKRVVAGIGGIAYKYRGNCKKFEQKVREHNNKFWDTIDPKEKKKARKAQYKIINKFGDEHDCDF